MVERQLGAFERENAELLEEAEGALRAYDRAERDEAEERYGDYLVVVEAGQDALVELREAYAAGLDFDTAEEYRGAFNRLARKQFRRFALDLD